MRRCKGCQSPIFYARQRDGSWIAVESLEVQGYRLLLQDLLTPPQVTVLTPEGDLYRGRQVGPETSGTLTLQGLPVHSVGRCRPGSSLTSR